MSKLKDKNIKLKTFFREQIRKDEDVYGLQALSG